MQLTRDSDYAMRIMIGMTECLEEAADASAGVEHTGLLLRTGIPWVRFNRIVRRLEEHGILREEKTSQGETRIHAGDEFWSQSVRSIAQAVEGNTKVFALFDMRLPLYVKYGGELIGLQEEVDGILEGATIRGIARMRKKDRNGREQEGGGS